ncbi:MAG TPA: ABC transporter ATP-binding protein [Bryobacteraceae bacterium]|jgi:ATP-binding cassette subfamily B protein|nr:ABC transporter ATP-binding protein [Bryobacteraceae bacterium]
MDRLSDLAWPASQLGEALSALLSKPAPSEFIQNPDRKGGAWIEHFAKHFDCEAERLETTLSELRSELVSAAPLLLKLGDSGFLAVVNGRKQHVHVLSPDRTLHNIHVDQICRAVREPAERSIRPELEQLLAGSGIAKSKQGRTLNLLLEEHLAARPFRDCWRLRLSAGADTAGLLAEAGAIRNGAGLLVSHTAQYLLWLASWAILGRLSFNGHLDRGWLLAWALLLMTLIPFRLLTTWRQGLFAIGVGGFLKRRLLAGAMRLAPEEMRHCGVGSFLGQALEAEALESLALSGGIAGLLATIEIAVSAFVLGRLAILLLLWCALTAFLTWRFLRSYQRWTDARMDLTQDLVESMVGHRTRLAQQPKEEWHTAEDQALDGYLAVSRQVDNCGTWLIGVVPRGWLLVALASLAPSIVAGKASTTETAILLGGILLAYTAFHRMAASFIDIAGCWVAWIRIAPLFRAAARPEVLGEIATVEEQHVAEKLIEADRLSFRYRNEGNPVLQSCSLLIRRGDRILLEGPSGGGKTTFASLLSGVRQPQSGLLLVNGLDRQTLGIERWRQCVAAAPQFHENHILTETLAFNLLMGRRWPPTPGDMEEAESVCRELGLGDLLEKMPSGLLQMVGEGGWQLSHGERSRVYIARALLQNADLVVLDESFAALDPENLETALECTLRRAETAMVIAHP